MDLCARMVLPRPFVRDCLWTVMGDLSAARLAGFRGLPYIVPFES